MNFGELFKKAWQIIWKHKILWLFGVLAGCGTASYGGGGGGGGGGGSTSSMQIGRGPGSWEGFPLLEPGTQAWIENALLWLESIPWWVWVLLAIAVVLVSLILSVLLMMVGTLGSTGVIKGTSMADEAGVESQPISFTTIFTAIKPYYWRVFLLNFGLRILGLFAGILLAIPVFIFVICTCCLGLFLLVPIGWFIDLLVTFTTITIIEEDQGIFDGIGRAWQIITRKLGNVVVMFLILGIGQMIIGFFISLPLLLVPLPLVINLFATGFEAVTGGLILSGILLMVFVPVIVFLSGILKAYVLTSWTLTYRRLTSENTINLLEPSE